MNQFTNTLSIQEVQRVIKAIESVIDGLRMPYNEYSIVATHTGAQTAKVFTQCHILTKQEVARINLRANHCEVIFNPSLRRAVLFLPYDAIETISNYDHATPDNVSLYVAERSFWDVIIGYEPEYGMISA